MYQRPNFPMTWARPYGKGRVFYTSMGHREDVWENPMYQGLLLGALGWATGRVDANIEPNIRTGHAQVRPATDLKTKQVTAVRARNFSLARPEGVLELARARSLRSCAADPPPPKWRDAMHSC